MLHSGASSNTFVLDLAKLGSSNKQGSLLKKGEGMRNVVLQILLPESKPYKIEISVKDLLNVVSAASSSFRTHAGSSPPQ